MSRSGKPEDFEASFHDGFAPFMPDSEHRTQMFKALTAGEGDPTETSLVRFAVGQATYRPLPHSYCPPNVAHDPRSERALTEFIRRELFAPRKQYGLPPLLLRLEIKMGSY